MALFRSNTLRDSRTRPRSAWKLRRVSEEDKSLWLALNIVLAMLTSLLSPSLIELRPSEQLLLGIVVFVALEILQLIWVLSRIALHQSNDLIHWTASQEVGERFRRMSDDFSIVCRDSHGPRDLFVSHLLRDIARLEERIHLASAGKELRVSEEFIINVDGVFDSLDGQQPRIIRISWPVLDNKKIFQNVSERRFFEVLSGRANSGSVEKVKILFVVPHDMDACDNFRAFAALVSHHKSFEARWIETSTFEEVLAANGLNRSESDMGIYADRMLYRTEQFEPRHVSVYTKDSAKVGLFLRVFEETWMSDGISHSVSTLEPPTNFDPAEIK